MGIDTKNVKVLLLGTDILQFLKELFSESPFTIQASGANKWDGTLEEFMY